MSQLFYLFKKVFFMLKEVFYLVRKHKLYFLAPLLISLAILGFFVYYIGPAIVVSFIYAGI